MLLEQLYYMYYNTRPKNAPKGGHCSVFSPPNNWNEIFHILAWKFYSAFILKNKNQEIVYFIIVLMVLNPTCEVVWICENRWQIDW
jgi:hypothetical protein